MKFMQNIIFFDTETTGNTEKDFLCQIAYKNNEGEFSGMYKPEKKIPPEASAVHHISNKMIENKPSFKESGDYKKIKKIFEDTSNIAVAHNAPFDIAILKNEDIPVANFICTLRVARALDTEGKIEKYNLQYLRYLLEIEIEAQAHDAMGDVMVLEKLFERLLKKIMDTDNVDESTAIQKMIEISSHPSIFRKINFGKYVGQNLEDIARTDRGYLEWLYNQKLQSDTIEEDWIYTLKHYLGK
ncbi:MAG: exonuclease domain-containing protein [Candidatus Nomurabacteria bacterium]|nr:exonuclease domain-containing protein [Candidatus Nomurabacteria bacterium]